MIKIMIKGEDDGVRVKQLELCECDMKYLANTQNGTASLYFFGA